MNIDDEFEYVQIMSPQMLVLPGVDQAFAYQLRNRALDALNEIEQVCGIQENHPLLEVAITMDECVAFTQAVRMN